MNGETMTTAIIPTHNQVAELQPIKFTPDQRQLILNTCCGGANESEARSLVAIAEARGLNPIAGECYFVKRYDSEKQTMVWAVQASIDSFRISAEKTGLYAGQDEPEYEYDDAGKLRLARVKVYRRDWTRPAIGVARWDEYVQTKKDGTPARFWTRMPHNQLAKCAEALAMRKAFPKVFANIYAKEEMQQAEGEEQTGEAPAPRTQQLASRIRQRAPKAEQPEPKNIEAVAAVLRGSKDMEQLKASWKQIADYVKAGQLTLDEAEKLQVVKDQRKSELQRAEEPSDGEPPADVELPE